MPVPAHQLVDTHLAARATGVTPATIRKWIQRGHLTRHGTDHRRALVDMNEIKTHLEQRDASSPREAPRGQRTALDAASR